MSNAIRLRPDFGEAYRKRGSARLQMGQNADADADFKMALSLEKGR